MLIVSNTLFRSTFNHAAGNARWRDTKFSDSAIYLYLCIPLVIISSKLSVSMLCNCYGVGVIFRYFNVIPISFLHY